MNIVILNTSERTGGAAIAANRLMHALRKENEHACMLVRDRQTDDPSVYSINTSWFRKQINRFRFVLERMIIFVLNKFDRADLFRVSIANAGTDISRHPFVKQADIIHLHWINHNFLSLKNIEKLLKLGKPVVWTMHDMWSCTGICHHARDCNRYQHECGNCFHLNSTCRKDISHRIFRKKKKILKNSRVVFVGCSKWLANRASSSELLPKESVYSIPNPLDINLFKRMNREDVRKQLRLPADKYLLLFGALNVTDKQKGFDYLTAGLKHLEQQFPEIYRKTELVIFGQVKSKIPSIANLPIHSMNYLTDESKIITLYNAVDLFVTASLEENLPNTIMEAMACGTPCVGFNTGGIPEMIDHKINGYVAEYKSPEDLAAGINWCLNPENSSKLPEEAMLKVKNCYAENIVAKQYIDLYIKAKAK
ncbi:MAG: glycosyltransferase family 4 protein [Dysgonamonadaceae bacterium]|jgi:glycosyltransferase involved in cell wall biosynthesis|nr:glycosyltransferase family 4 protein [Dysgonamonadaceae bacterium]